jgi:hypothetical protein
MTLKTLLFLLPLSYSILIYVLLGHYSDLAAIFLFSLLVAGVGTALIAGFNLFGSGENASGTMIIFITATSASFYGLAYIGTQGSSLGRVIANAFNWVINQGNPPTSGSLFTSAASALTFPYKELLDIIFGVMFAFGVFFLITDRGSD